jgi:hypothetical protein
MTVKPRRRGGHLPDGPRPSAAKLPATRPVGRPKGEPSTLVNVRLPLTRLAPLDRDRDQVEWPPGLNAHRGMIARRALARFLASHTAEMVSGREG